MASLIQKPLLGAHLSTEGGLDKVFSRAEAINANTLQLFTKSNRQWQAKPFLQSEIETFKNSFKNSPVKLVVAHASYLINLGSSKDEIRQKSAVSLKEELDRCEMLGIPYLVLHPGSAGDGAKPDAINYIAQALNTIFKESSGKTMIVLENAAGQGATIGSNLAELNALYQIIENKERVGICIDTCHAFAAGYDLGKDDLYTTFWHEFYRLFPQEALKLIHLNDSKKELGSAKDRHENIGKGQLAANAFKLIMNDPMLSEVPKILETPKDGKADDNKEYAEEIDYLTSLIEVR